MAQFQQQQQQQQQQHSGNPQQSQQQQLPQHSLSGQQPQSSNHSLQQDKIMGSGTGDGSMSNSFRGNDQVSTFLVYTIETSI